MGKGAMLLIRKNQLGEITKTAPDGEDYETIVIILKEDMLRKIALEEQIEIGGKYTGQPNIHIPGKRFSARLFPIRDTLCPQFGREDNGLPGHAKSERRGAVIAA